jgi:hypothetical protein
LGNSTCTSYYKCKNCGQTVNKRIEDHTCGNVYCKTCKDYYPSATCYLWITTIHRRTRLTSFSILNVPQMTVSSTYANILKYHIQGMPTKIYNN